MYKIFAFLLPIDALFSYFIICEDKLSGRCLMEFTTLKRRFVLFKW